MADIQYWDDTLTDEVETIQSILDSASNAEGIERNASLDRAEKKLRSANGTKRSYKMECRLVSDPNQRSRYENQLRRHEQKLSALGNDLKALRAGTQKGELFLGAAEGGVATMPGGKEGEVSAEQAGDYLLNEASGIQDKTQESLNNTKKMVAESKDVGMSTVEELYRQRQQIENIDSEVDRIEDNLARADRLIKAFGKRMATDKFIQCFACINVLLLVGVVVYSITKDGNLSGGRDEGEPESPVRRLVEAGVGLLRGTGLPRHGGGDLEEDFDSMTTVGGER